MEARLWFLGDHGGGFNRADGGLGRLLGWLRKGVDVVKDIGLFSDTESVSKLAMDVLRE